MEKFLTDLFFPKTEDDAFPWTILFVLPCVIAAITCIESETAAVIIGCIIYGLNLAIHFATKGSSSSATLVVGYFTAIGSCVSAFFISGEWWYLVAPLGAAVFYVIISFLYKRRIL